MQVMYLCPSHWSGQGAHSSRLANLKQIVTGRRGKEERGSQEGEQEQNGVTKISFDRKDIMLLSTPPPTSPPVHLHSWNSCIGCLSTDGPAFITASILCVTSESICPCQLFTSTLQFSAVFFFFFLSFFLPFSWAALAAYGVPRLGVQSEL